MDFSVTRIDLADTGSPMGLVTAILKAEPNLAVPTPIEKLCRQLDIIEIQEMTTKSFEGGLLTQRTKNTGIILFRKGTSPQRKRFTIAHELGHFLMPLHHPSSDVGFQCSKSDLLKQNGKELNKRAKMEVEANLFASLILMPPPHLRRVLNSCGYPCLSNVIKIHKTFDVSKEAAARAYAEYSPETIAVVIVKDSRILRTYRNRKFPWIVLEQGDKVPAISILHSHSGPSSISPSEETPAENWIDTDWGETIPKMYEQVMLQENGFAMIQLKVFGPHEDEFSANENLNSKQRYVRQQERYSR